MRKEVHFLERCAVLFSSANDWDDWHSGVKFPLHMPRTFSLVHAQKNFRETLQPTTPCSDTDSYWKVRGPWRAMLASTSATNFAPSSVLRMLQYSSQDWCVSKPDSKIYEYERHLSPFGRVRSSFSEVQSQSIVVCANFATHAEQEQGPPTLNFSSEAVSDMFVPLPQRRTALLLLEGAEGDPPHHSLAPWERSTAIAMTKTALAWQRELLRGL